MLSFRFGRDASVTTPSAGWSCLYAFSESVHNFPGRFFKLVLDHVGSYELHP